MTVTSIAFHNLYEELNRDNKLFEQLEVSIGDNLLLPFAELRNMATELGITVATLPCIPPEGIDAYVFVDMPDPDSMPFRRALASKRPLYLVVLESKLIHPANYDPVNLQFFKKIFTYDDSMVDGARFIKINYSFRMPEKIQWDLSQKNRFCVTVASNKRSRHHQELYSERIKAIRWFECNHPEDFDLYGVGWDVGTIGKGFPRVLTSRCRWLRRLGQPLYPSWRGTVERKRDVMGLYRFALCYENMRDVPGYITEKIFDAFFAGSVPVYRGASNVTDHIPSECFIDLRKFPDYAELYAYLSGMTNAEYQSYLSHIEDFLTDERSRPFSSQRFAETILKGILHE